MVLKKLNCWEYIKCGREPGGQNAIELGTCPAAMDKSYSGINSGKYGGRFCWAVSGTFCDGETQGTFAEKRDSCLNCGFYKLVRAEEGTANLRTKFLRFVPLDRQRSMLDGLTYKHIKKGERFLTQGEEGNSAYIIERGSCIVIVEKDGIEHPVGHRGEGDIVDMMALLTGEPRSAHVEAETDMSVWVLDKDRLDHISDKDHELLDFFTELVAERFDSRRPTADRTIGRYIATDIIGRGGYSLVYKGVHERLNMPVAIKMMRHDLAMRSEFLTTFRNEAEIIAEMNHENIIRMYNFKERFRTVFIIMEYLEGENLRELLQRLKTIPPMLTVNYLLQTCNALAYAHNKNIVHRDINPTNIFIQKNHRLKLIDFGVACPVGTDDHFFGGALHYLAPELFDGEPADRRSDIYALGITAYEIVTGKRPYPEEGAAALMKMHRNQDIPDPIEVVPDLPEALRRFILTACMRDPDKRYQDADSALEELNKLK
ncbi:MAG: protein kinase [Desulfobacterales bacterium]|nr:protein kinase [Desulfobacterales bacterium]